MRFRSSIAGALLGGMLLGYINNWLIPDVLNDVPSKLGLNFSMTQIEYGIFGFLLVVVISLSAAVANMAAPYVRNLLKP